MEENLINDKVKELEDQIAYSDNEKKVDLLNSLSKEVVDNNPKRALFLSKKAYHLSKKRNYTYGIAQSLLMVSNANINLSNYAEGITQLLEAMDLFTKLDHKEGEMKSLNLLGINYFYLGRYEEALENFTKSQKLAEDIDHRRLQSSIFNNIGEIYRELEKYEDALDYYFKALEISENIKAKQNTNITLMNIGHLYHCLNENEKSLEYYQKGLNISQEIKDKISQGETLNKIGEINEELNNLDMALKYYLESFQILQACENKFYQIDTLFNLGNLYIKEKKYREGLGLLKKALNLGEKISAQKKIYAIHLSLSRYYEDMGDFFKSLDHYKRYHDIEKQVTIENLEQTLKIRTVGFKVDQIQQKAEIYRLKNIELKQKNKEIENKARQLTSMNEKLKKEILKKKELQKHLEQANKKLSRLSNMDELTGIPNRRNFNDTILKEWNRCLRGDVPISIILVDIDYFKNFNDNYGHPEGDECLKKVAKILAHTLKRSSDFIGRYGGEEFAIILPNSGYGDCMIVAERMRKKVESLKIEHEYSPISSYITISLGAATILPSMDSHYHDLINAADKELYHAKNMGRNLACCILL